MTRRRASSAERHSRMSSTWRMHPRHTLCSSSRHRLMHGDGTAGLTLLYSGLGGRAEVSALTFVIDGGEVELATGLLQDDSGEHLAQQLFALVALPVAFLFVVVEVEATAFRRQP